MTFDILSAPLDAAGWAEPASENGFAAHWDRELFGIEIPPWRQNVVRWIEQAYHAGNGRPVVVGDIGCGAVLYARHLLAAGVPFEYHGYDHNAGVLGAACRRWAFLPHNDVHLHQMDARAAPWPIVADSFDVLVWDTTLRFCDNAEAALDESRRVCRGWILIARTPLEGRTWRESVHYYGMATPSPNWHFDERFFRDHAHQHEWSFTPRVADDELHVLSRSPLSREISVRPVPNLARTFHEGYVRERVANLFERIPGAWALYGAGHHTRWLLAALPDAARARVGCICDDAAAPGQEVCGIQVVPPSLGRGQGMGRLANIAAVLISSDTIEDKLVAAARNSLPSALPVYRLYKGFPIGPYDKSLAGIGFACERSPERKRVGIHQAANDSDKHPLAHARGSAGSL